MIGLQPRLLEIEQGSFGGVEICVVLDTYNIGRRGSRVVTVDDENDNPLCDPTTQQARWRRHWHFTTVLNV